MNSYILQATIIDTPELRTVGDNQQVTQFNVDFLDSKEERAHHLRCIVWGDKAQEAANLTIGIALALEGRLSMNQVERPEGFKEKRAEFNVSRWHILSGSPAPASTKAPATQPAQKQGKTTSKPAAQKQPVAAAPSTDDFDDIPF